MLKVLKGKKLIIHNHLKWTIQLIDGDILTALSLWFTTRSNWFVYIVDG
jgi:hypothetical protein